MTKFRVVCPITKYESPPVHTIEEAEELWATWIHNFQMGEENALSCYSEHEIRETKG